MVVQVPPGEDLFYLIILRNNREFPLGTFVNPILCRHGLGSICSLLRIPDEGEFASCCQGIEDEGLLAFLRVAITSRMALGSRDYWGHGLTERLPNWLRSSEAGGFINGDPAEGFCENGPASLCVDVVVSFQAEEEGAEVWSLSLEL